MKHENVRKINQIFIEETGVDFFESMDKREKNFFSNEVRIEPRELLFVIVRLGKEFDITGLKKAVEEDRLRSFDDLVKNIECDFLVQDKERSLL